MDANLRFSLSRCRHWLVQIPILVLATFGVGGGHSVAGTIRIPLQYPTIQAGVNIALPGDTVLVAPGIYEERVTVDTSRLALFSEINGAANIHMDKVAVLINGDSCSIRGFRIESGVFAGWTSLSIAGQSALVESCAISKGSPCVFVNGGAVFLECTISEGQGGILVRDGGDILLERCDIVDNFESDGGGIAISSHFDQPASQVTLRDCNLLRNEASLSGGALLIAEDIDPPHRVVVENCLFGGNRAPIGAAVAIFSNDFTMRSCTLAGNVVTVGNGSVIYNGDSGLHAVNVERCIIAFNSGPALNCEFGGQPIISCCDVFGNSDDSLCGQDGGDNLSLDPLFCALADENFFLSESSPCAPGNAPVVCGLIGAFPPSCISTVFECSWGEIKHRYSSRARR